MQMKPTKQSRYAYVIEACCFLLIFTNMGFVTTTFNVFQPYINALPGVGDTLGGWITAVRMLASFVATFFSTAWYRRFECRLGATLSCACTAIGLVVNAFSTSFLGFVIGAIFLGTAFGTGAAVVITLLIGRWFHENQATALGIAGMGSGFTAIAIPIIVTRLIESVSLTAAFLFEAAIAAIVAIVVFALVRNHPPEALVETQKAARNARGVASASRLGETDGVRETAGKRPEQPEAPRPGQTEASRPEQPETPRPRPRPRALGTERLPQGPYMLLLLAILLASTDTIGVNAYVSVLFQTNGFSSLFAATMITIAGFIIIISKFLVGRSFDRLGPIPTVALFYGMSVLGAIFLCLSPLHSATLAAAGMVFNYLGAPVGSVGISVYAIMFSTLDERARTIRNFQLAYTAGSFLTNLFPGVLYDLLGTYIVSYALYGFFAFCAGAIIVSVLRRWGVAKVQARM